MSTLGYGGGVLALPDALGGWPWLVGGEPPPLPDPVAAIDGALRRPDGAPALETFVEPGDRVVVVIQTEIPAAPRELCIRRVAELLRSAGCAEISWLEATGSTHNPGGCRPLELRRSQEPDEGGRSNGPAHRGVSHRASEGAVATYGPASAGDQLGGGFEPIGWVRGLSEPEASERKGALSRDARVKVSASPSPRAGHLQPKVAAPLRRADKLILVGMGSFDPIAGFGGGAQLAALGCADPATSRALLLRGVEAGATQLQQTFAAVMELLPPAFLVQIELQRGDRMAAIFAGDPRRAFAASTAFHRRWHERELEGPLDLIVASAGGEPADWDLSAALPSLLAAASALRPGGGLIFAAACPGGLGQLDRIPIEACPCPSERSAAAGGSPKDRAGRGSALSRILHAALADRHCWIVSEGLVEFETTALGLSLSSDLETAVESARLAGISLDRVAILEGSRTIPALPSNPR